MVTPHPCRLGALACALSVGCVPLQTRALIEGHASVAVVEAERVAADRFAPYEMAAARAFLAKAREERGEASYEAAQSYAQQAEELAIRARAVARTRAQRPAGATEASTR